MGINNRKEQDWWRLCSTTPLVWDQITYTSPTHCESRVGAFPLECLTKELICILGDSDGEGRSRCGMSPTTVVCNAD